MERRIFNHPIRKGITDEFYPDKFSLDQFKDQLKAAIDPFCENMKNLGGVASEDQFIEQWYEQFLAWCDIEEER